jgi:hypothetical protein
MRPHLSNSWPPEQKTRPLLIDFGGLAEDERIIDVGCGNGSLTFELARTANLREIVAAAWIRPGSEKPLGDSSRRSAVRESPLVHVLIDALASDCAARTGVSKAKAKYLADAAIQNLLGI